MKPVYEIKNRTCGFITYRGWIICILGLIILTTMMMCRTQDSAKRNNSAGAKDEDAQVSEQRSDAAFFSVLSDYRNYYAEYDPMCFTAIEPVSTDVYGLQLKFDSNLPGLIQIECAEEGKEFSVLKDKSLFVPLDKEADVSQDRMYRIRPVFSPPQKESVCTIRVNCMTKKAFEKLGGKRTVDIVKLSSEPRLSFGTNNPEGWETYKPTESDVAFAKKQWGHLLEGATSDYEKAKILTKALMRDMIGHGGLPKAFIYSLPTYEKYIAITSGKSGHACGQYSEMFSWMCNCFGVINRRGFINDGLQNKDMLIELGSSHLVTEIFDRDLNQWVFIDGRYSTLGAYLGDIGPLTLHEFFLFMNQPNRRSKLKILHYDAAKDQELMMLADDNPKPYNSYLGWTKGYHTQYRNE